MTSRTERDQHKALTRAFIQKRRVETIASMPILQADLVQLFEFLDNALVAGCDHSFRFTRQFLQANNLPEATIVPWLGNHGGYCDCEVLANVEDGFQQ